MLKRFNHVAIVVPDLDDASRKYKDVLNASVSDVHDYAEHGVSVVFVDLGNTKIELMQPYGNNSPIKNFLDKNSFGGIHHICLEVKDIIKMREKLVSNNLKILGDGEPKLGAHNKLVLFLHPKDFYGTLIELEQE